jgi:hypothetical protein
MGLKISPNMILLGRGTKSNLQRPVFRCDAAGVPFLARSVSEGDHETTVRQNEREKRKRTRTQGVTVISGAWGPSWSPSLTLRARNRN